MSSGSSTFRWSTLLSLSLLGTAMGCATLAVNPDRLLVDDTEPAPLGYHGPGEVARLAPPQSDPCTAATARACYERGLALATGEDGELDRLRALSLLEKACNGDVREACDFLKQHVTPSRLRGSTWVALRLPGRLDGFARAKCRLTEGGILRGCVLEGTNLYGKHRVRALESLRSFMDEARFELLTFDGEPFETTVIIEFHI